MDRKFKLHHFENGFKLLTLPIKKGKDNLLYVCMDILCGSDLENSKNLEQGHFLEHLNGFFTSSKYPDGKQNELTINNLGISANASVTSSITSYYMNGLSEHKDLMIDMIMNSYIDFKTDSKIIKQERNAVIKELQQRRNNIWNSYYHKENKVKYPGHYRRENIINYNKRIKSTKKATPKELLLFREQNYKFDRSMLTLSGDFGSSREIIKLICNLMNTKLVRKPGKLSKYEELFPIIHPPKTTKKNMIHFVHNKNVKTSKFKIFFKIPFDAFSNEKFKFNMISSLLTRGLGSILKRRLRSKLGLVYYVSTDEELSYSKAYSYFDISTEVDHEKIPLAIDAVLNEIRKLKKKLITPKQLKKIRNSVIYDFAKRKYTDKLSYWANTYFFKTIWNRKVIKIKQLKKIYLKITRKQIRDIFRKCFHKHSIKIIYSGSGKNLNTHISKLKNLKKFDS